MDISSSEESTVTAVPKAGLIISRHDGKVKAVPKVGLVVDSAVGDGGDGTGDSGTSGYTLKRKRRRMY